MNTLICIDNMCGTRDCFLNISVEDAVKRYVIKYPDVNPKDIFNMDAIPRKKGVIGYYIVNFEDYFVSPEISCRK